jgi:3-phenylpropionate/cinnamic acid dioxygenase small subunit
MIQENTTNTRINKSISRKRYAERQFGKWVKWSIAQKGCVLFKEVIEKQIEYKIITL